MRSAVSNALPAIEVRAQIVRGSGRPSHRHRGCTQHTGTDGDDDLHQSRAAAARGSRQHATVGQPDGNRGVPCYGEPVRVRAGATAFVALTAAMHARTSAGAARDHTVTRIVATMKSRRARSEFLVAPAQLERGPRLAVKW